jgi:soluble lytic murein transglycosylase-like protein
MISNFKQNLYLLAKSRLLGLIPATLSLYTTLSITQTPDTSKELKTPYQLTSTAELKNTQAASDGQPSNKSWSRIVYEQSQLSLVSQIIEHNKPDHPHRDAIAKSIITEGQRAQIDPLLIAAVVHTESTFKHTATSPRGAKGLMQLMPQTGRYIAKINKINFSGAATLNDPQLNIRLGVLYLKQLQERFHGDLERTLVAYNWGPSNLAKALASGASFPQESQRYVRRVRERHALWSAKLAGADFIALDSESRAVPEHRMARLERGLMG